MGERGEGNFSKSLSEWRKEVTAEMGGLSTSDVLLGIEVFLVSDASELTRFPPLSSSQQSTPIVHDVVV